MQPTRSQEPRVAKEPMNRLDGVKAALMPAPMRYHQNRVNGCDQTRENVLAKYSRYDSETSGEDQSKPANNSNLIAGTK